MQQLLTLLVPTQLFTQGLATQLCCRVKLGGVWSLVATTPDWQWLILIAPMCSNSHSETCTEQQGAIAPQHDKWVTLTLGNRPLEAYDQAHKHDTYRLDEHLHRVQAHA